MQQFTTDKKPSTLSSLVEGDEGSIGPSGKLFCKHLEKICSICMAIFHTCLTVGPIQLFISFY